MEKYLNQKDGTFVVNVPTVAYSPEEFHKFIQINHDKNYKLAEKFPDTNSSHVVKVIKVEPYEMSDIHRAILQSIEETEKARKDFESKI